MIGERDTRDVSRTIQALLIITAAVLGAYGVVLSSTYGALDDYSFLLDANGGQDSILDLLIGAGRPLNAYALNLAFGSVHSVADLAWLRAITLIGLIVLSGSFYFSCRRHGLGNTASLAISCGVILLPSFQVYAAWAQHLTTPYAGAIALLSAFLMTPAGGARLRSRALAFATSTALLLAAIVTYQPIAMLYCTGILISVLASGGDPRQWTASRAVEAASVFVAAMVLGYVAFKLGQQLHPGNFSRYGLTTDVQGKLKWFFSQPLRNALSLYSVPANSTVGGWVAAALAFGAVIAFIRFGLRSLWIMIVASLICLAGSYAPNLVTAENWASYRSTGSLCATLLVLVVIALRQPSIGGAGASRFGWQKFGASRFLPLLAAVALLAITALAQSNVLNGLVLPNVAELDNVASALAYAEHENSQALVLAVNPSSWADSAAKPLAYDEFGIQSSNNEWYAREIVEIVLRETNSRAGAVVDSASPSGPPRSLENSGAVPIDFPRFASSQKFRHFATTPLNAGHGEIFPLDINDENWTRGIWSNKSRRAYSLVYRAGYGDRQLRPGERLRFARSGVRTVLQVDISGDFVNVLVDGPPLTQDDGHPHAVTRIAGTP